MIDLNLLRTFAKVVELGSFTKAALHLKQPKSRVSRAIGRLELDLGAQLIRRTTRQVSLTEAGQALFSRTNDLLLKLNNEIELVSLETHELRGTIKISAPEDFSQLILPPIIAEFTELHPNIDFQIIASNQRFDLAANDIDVAFRIGTLKDSALIHKKIGYVKTILAASPEYIAKYGSPTKLEDLKNHKILNFVNQHNRSLLEEIFTEKNIDETLTPLISCNSFPLLHKFACEGKGIAILPDFYSKTALGEGRLVQTVDMWKDRKVNIQMVYLPNKNLPKKIRTFIDFVAQKTQFLNS